jgi:hypothetical protein
MTAPKQKKKAKFRHPALEIPVPNAAMAFVKNLKIAAAAQLIVSED